MKDAEKEATTEDNIFAQSINSIMHQKAEQELGKDYATLFGRTHERAQGYNIGQRLLDAHYDDIIEFAFVAMVNAITEYSQRIEIGVDAAKNTGKETASIINSEQLVSDMTKKFKSVAKQEAEKTSMLKSFTSLRTSEYPFEWQPVEERPIKTSPSSILSPVIIFSFSPKPTPKPARSYFPSS